MKIAYGFMAIMILASCGGRKEKETPLDTTAYHAEIDAWHRKRVEDLKGHEGWLNLAGLYWLKEGINTFGSAKENDIVFPEGTIEPKAGVFILKEGRVTLKVLKGVAIESGNQPVSSLVAYPPDSASSAVFMTHDSLEWFVVKRENKYGIRLRNFRNPSISKFNGIDRFKVDPAWRLTASLERADSTKTIEITNVLGQTFRQRSPGTLIFYIDGKKYRLDALDEGEKEYFVIFGDATNAKETYGAGRYLYVSPVDSSGRTFVDFNKAYNPPCAFTQFATCPLPPRQNILAVPVTAGEKNYGDHK
jgi:uncharacterized protein (DUF1684 family)